MPDSLPTFFAPAQRSTREETARFHEAFESEKSVCDVLHHVSNLVLILDRNRQVVFANKAAVKALGKKRPEELLGARPGEAMGCVHSSETPGGCGTSPSCRYCGSVNSILKSQKGHAATEECRFLVHREGREEAVDLRVWASPIEVGGVTYTFFSAVDIAEEKRKTFLEKIFLHDIMNTATALRGFSSLAGMEGMTEEERSELLQHVGSLSERIIDEINAQRMLVAAESNELTVQVRTVDSRGVLQSVFESYDRPEYLDQRHLEIHPAAVSLELESDPTLLTRVIGNMTKNAIEASVPGETVVLGCEPDGDAVVFWVRNPTYMPENIRLQVFNRSFSTKGSGRGLGTYSMKYLTEKYLQGRISFESTEKEGTVFRVRYARTWSVPRIPASEVDA